jgi:hypothetical protein
LSESQHLMLRQAASLTCWLTVSQSAKRTNDGALDGQRACLRSPRKRLRKHRYRLDASVFYSSKQFGRSCAWTLLDLPEKVA